MILVHYIVYSDYCSSHEHSSLTENVRSDRRSDILKKSEPNPNTILTEIAFKTCRVSHMSESRSGKRIGKVEFNQYFQH